MILSTLKKTLKTLGAPLLWTDEKSQPPFIAVQGISITCDKSCDNIVLGRLSVKENHINITFSATRNGSNTPNHTLCFLDAEILPYNPVYPLIGASDKFIRGYVTINAIPVSDLDYSGYKMYVNPLYVHKADTEDALDSPTLKIGKANAGSIAIITEIPLNKLNIVRTTDVNVQSDNGSVQLSVAKDTGDVDLIPTDLITSINGVPFSADNSTCKIDLTNTGASVLYASSSYVELIGPGNNTCGENSLKGALAPNGRLYKCPIDILYVDDIDSASVGVGYNNTATANDYDINRLNNHKFNKEYSGTQKADGCFEGLDWDELNELHD